MRPLLRAAQTFDKEVVMAPLAHHALVEANLNARVTDTTSLTARIARTSTMTGREGQTALFFAAQQG